jgi:hypothetical protein
MDKTNNFQLKLLKYNQAQKEVSINEAILVLDAMASRVAIDFVEGLPGTADVGEMFILSAKDGGKIALRVNGWRYFTPIEGWEFWIQKKNLKYRFHNKKWDVVK